MMSEQLKQIHPITRLKPELVFPIKKENLDLCSFHIPIYIYFVL